VKSHPSDFFGGQRGPATEGNKPEQKSPDVRGHTQLEGKFPDALCAWVVVPSDVDKPPSGCCLASWPPEFAADFEDQVAATAEVQSTGQL